MATLTLDKGLETEKQFPIMNFFEHLLSKKLNANYSARIDGDKLPEIPEIDSDNPSFSTVEIVDDNGISIPITGTYNIIVDISISYFKETSEYNLSVVLGYKKETV